MIWKPYSAFVLPAAVIAALVLGWPNPPAPMRGSVPDETLVEEMDHVAQEYYIAGIVIPPPPRPVIRIDSQTGADQRPVAEWRLFNAAAGALDRIVSDRVTAAPPSIVAAGGTDVLEVSGWAGDRALGIRFPFVAVATCNQIVAIVPVDQPRQDIADSVHPNLGAAGWRARLLARDLPRCEGMNLRAYAIASTHRLILPLEGAAPLAIIDLATPLPFDVERAPLPVRLEDVPNSPPQANITAANATNLRRCGDLACDVVGALPAGRQTVALLDQTPDWLLISAPGAAGWIARRVVRTELLPSEARF